MKNIDDQIRRAIEEGQFDNLPGKGKPLKLDENAHENPEWHLANKILKDGGFSLPWIERRHEIDEGLEAARTGLRRAWEWRQERLGENQPYAAIEAEWQRALDAFREKIAKLNKEVFAYNLETPSMNLQIRALYAEREIAAIVEKD